MECHTHAEHDDAQEPDRIFDGPGKTRGNEIAAHDSEQYEPGKILAYETAYFCNKIHHD